MILKRRTKIVKETLKDIKQQLEQDKILESYYYFIPAEEVNKIIKKERKYDRKNIR